MSGPQNRDNNFDAVRLLAAAAVIFGHAHPLTNTPSPVLFGNSVQAIAVKIFFVISGFLICKSWVLDPNPFRYFTKRAVRIFPALIVITIISAFVLGPLLTSLPLIDYLTSPRTYLYLKNILLYPIYDLPGLFANNTYPVAVNGSLWSLPVEFAMYLTIPFAITLATIVRRKASIWLAAVALCAVSLSLVRLHAPEKHPVLYGTDLISALDVAPYFLIGASIAYTGLERFMRPVIALFLLGILTLFQPSSAVASEIALYILLPICVLATCINSETILKGAGYLGDFSYGLYLYGFLIQQIVNQIFHNSLSALQNAAISLPISLLFAIASWHLIEKPALAKKPQRKSNLILKASN
nr:acyltransferase [Xanthomonas euvesicatoria]